MALELLSDKTKGIEPTSISLVKTRKTQVVIRRMESRGGGLETSQSLTQKTSVRW